METRQGWQNIEDICKAGQDGAQTAQSDVSPPQHPDQEFSYQPPSPLSPQFTQHPQTSPSTRPAPRPLSQLSSEDKVDDGAERFPANILHRDLVLAGLLHVAILDTMNYEMRTEIEK